MGFGCANHRADKQACTGEPTLAGKQTNRSTCPVPPRTPPTTSAAIKILFEMSNKIAFLFSWAGSQAVGMGRELCQLFPVAADTFREADEALGFPLSTLCFEGPEEQLRLTENTQPAILTASIAAFRVLAQHGIAPALAAGHSLGEWSAHVAAGTLSFADAVRAVRARGRAMQQAVPPGEGAMAPSFRCRPRLSPRSVQPSRPRPVSSSPPPTSTPPRRPSSPAQPPPSSAPWPSSRPRAPAAPFRCP